MAKPGPKKGQRHSGQFRAGHDGRRHTGGRMPNHKRDFTDLARSYSEEAMRFMHRCVTEFDGDYENVSMETRLKAANYIVEHAHGKPVDQIQIRQLDSSRESDLALDMRSSVRGFLQKISGEEATEVEVVEDKRH